ncbi:MAG: 1-deoxy-D-xylulose-5-phosphate synthase [Deltaproteobacteria bacterium]|nr:1-deoxy-D-xylulose-5-phosphate synthase [Deltaproteobacteria bacterium]
MHILDRLRSPDDLKQLELSELQDLCGELREFIVDSVSKTGGHLAPNLGTIELAVAIHYVFNSPTDKIIWDVGHQAYAHKILTSRKDRFHTLRQYGGISGFPRREESPYDAFNTGHSSTSISAGLGIAVAKDFKKELGKVVAVIGDGAMTAGLAFEGLNNAGHLDKNLIVILNDNEMSISPNVGALSAFLSHSLTSKRYVRFKKEMGNILKTMRGIGENIITLVKKTEESFKSFFTPGMLFEALQFDYVGPIQGHRLDKLIPSLQKVSELEGPILMHVLTTKGKGYEPAECDPTRFHGVGCFDVNSGKSSSKSTKCKDYTSVFGETITKLAEKDKRIFAITAAMPEGTGLSLFAERIPERFYDVGIAEQHAVTFAAGLATEGLIPVVSIYSTFMQRAYDQVIHDVCIPGLHVVFAMDRGGLVGQDGATHQGGFDLSFMRSVPNMVVMAPADEDELRRMLLTAIRHNGPASLRYPRGAGEGLLLGDEISPVEIGRAKVLREPGEILIIAIGNRVYPSVRAAEKAEELGVRVGVVNARFAKPLDRETILQAVDKARSIITVEENALQGGFGSAVLELLSDQGVFKPFKRLGLPDRFIEHGTPEEQRRHVGIDEEGILKTIMEMSGMPHGKTEGG